MPTIRFQISDPGQLILNKDALKKELRLIGNEVKKKTQALIRSQASRNPHKSSQPGQAPASWTGNLAKLIRVQVKRNKVTITDTARYATALEAGATLNNGSVVAPRPYLSTVLDEMRPEIEKRLEAVLQLTMEKP